MSAHFSVDGILINDKMYSTRMNGNRTTLNNLKTDTRYTEGFGVFISYSSKDRGFITSLCESLLLMGMSVWLDRREIDQSIKNYNSEYLKKELRDGINSSMAFLIAIDDDSLRSEWVRYELSVLEERLRIDPLFTVVPLISSTYTEPLIGILKQYTPIDFSKGYKTAIAKLYQCFNPKIKKLSGLGAQAMIISGSRSLQIGMSFVDHLKTCNLSPERITMLLDIRNLFAKFEVIPRITDIVSVMEDLDAKGCFDMIISGNLPFELGQVGSGLCLAVSFLPTISLREKNQFPSMEDGVEVVILSIWLPQKDTRLDKMSTLIINYRPDGAAFMWLAQSGKLHRYTLGSNTVDSVVLGHSRKMGARKMAFQWPNNNPDKKFQHYRRALSNKLGLGGVQRGQLFSEPKNSISAYMLWQMTEILKKEMLPINLTKPKGSIIEIWEKIIAEKWMNPETDQAGGLFGHIMMGGIFIYEISPHSSISLTLSKQLNHIFDCAGAKVFQVVLENDDKSILRQFISISSLQKDFVQEYF